MRLRQVALVARDLDAVVDDCCGVLGLEVGFRDPDVAMFGLRNAVMPVGDTFLEVVSPVRDDATAARFLARRGGDGGYMVIIQIDDLERARRRLATLGVRVVFDVAFDDIATVHLHPRDVGGAILSLDVACPAASWRWAGPTWRESVRTDVTSALAGVELEATDADALSARWAAVLDTDRAPDADGWVIPLDGGTLRFTPPRDARGDGVAAVAVRTTDRERALAAARTRGLPVREDEVVLGGVRFLLR